MVFPTGMAARPAVTPLQASPANSHPVTLLPGLTDNASSSEIPSGAGETDARPADPAPTAAQTDKLIEEVLSRHTQSFEALDAFEDLSHGLLLAREKGQEVPCLGPGAEAWTSDDAIDQELAADLCLLCPVFALCQRYADRAKPEAGTWGGITRRRNHQPRPSSSKVPTRPRDTGLDCRCGCAGITRGGWYLTGHDAQHFAALRRAVRSGAMALDDALAEVAHSERLQAKLRR